MATSGPIAIGPVANARNYDAEIGAMQRQIDGMQAEAGKLRQKSDTLQSELNRIAVEKQTIQTQIDLSQAQREKLGSEIKANEDKIAQNALVSGEIMNDMAITDDEPLFMQLATSKNLADVVDAFENQLSVQKELKSSTDETKKLKKELEGQKVEVEKVIANQEVQRNELAAKQSEQNRLLEETRGEEAAYQSMIAETKQKLDSVAAQQREALSIATGNGRNSAGVVGSFEFRKFSGNARCGGGYPSNLCGPPLNSSIDQWRLYSRQCVSYTAWAAYSRFGKDVRSFAGMGHAYQWPETASQLMGATVNGTPAVGSVAIIPPQAIAPIYGHSMMVEDVLGDGWVLVSQYNFGGTGEYSTMEIRASTANYVHFNNR